MTLPYLIFLVKPSNFFHVFSKKKKKKKGDGTVRKYCESPEAPEEKSFEILNIFAIQMHKQAKLTSP